MQPQVENGAGTDLALGGGVCLGDSTDFSDNLGEGGAQAEGPYLCAS